MKAVISALAVMAATVSAANAESPFAPLLLQPLTEAQRSAVTEASEDFAAALAFQKPIHAKQDEFGIKDGGSWGYTGRGYRMIVWCAMSSFEKRITVYAYGPDVKFDTQLFPTVHAHITQVRFYLAEELAKHLQNMANQRPGRNAEAVSVSTSAPSPGVAHP